MVKLLWVRWVIVAALSCGAFTMLLHAAAAAIAQGGSSPPPAALPVSAPVVSDDVKRVVSELQVRASGLAFAIATLQKELDATTMPLQRTIQQAQATCASAPGYQLAPTLTCVKEPAPSTAEKK